MDKKITLFFLYLLLLLYLSSPVFAQEGLVVQSHVVSISQVVEEGKDPRLEISEQIRVENKSSQVYQGKLFFWVGETGKDATIIAIRDEEEGEEKDPKVLLSSSVTKEGLVSAQLAEEVFIKPGATREVGVLYSVFPDAKGEFFWQRKILYNHPSGSLQIEFNPVEQLGYKAKPQGFALSKSQQEEGWYASGALSPRIGDIYLLSVTKEETPTPAQEESQGKSLAVVGEQIRKLALENILVTFLVNNIFVLILVGLGFWWFSKRRR